MRERRPCVYLLASHRNGTLYAGVTSHLPARIWQHRNGVVEGFTQRHRVHILVWFELHEDLLATLGLDRSAEH